MFGKETKIKREDAVLIVSEQFRYMSSWENKMIAQAPQNREREWEREKKRDNKFLRLWFLEQEMPHVFIGF